MQDLEVYVVLALGNGEVLSRRFATCEEAWTWQRETTRKHANRRALKDRVQTRWSFYCGCTCRGNTYGGWLVGSQATIGAENLEMSQAVELRLAKQRPNWIG